MNSDDKTLNCILPSGTLTCRYFEYLLHTIRESYETGQRKSTDNVTEIYCEDTTLTSK